MFGFKPEIEISIEMIGRDEGIFVKTMFGFKESRANVSHKLKTHAMSVTSTKLTPLLSIY